MDGAAWAHLDEDELEPTHLIRRSSTIIRAGVLMLGAGTSSRRVRDVMRTAAAALDIDALQSQVTFTDIVLTVVRRGVFRTQVAEVPRPVVNAERIALLHHLGDDLRPHMRVDEVDARLRAIERRPLLYPTWLLTIVVALACASIAVLNNGGVLEVAAVLPSSAIAFAAQRFMARHRLNLIASMAIATMIAAGAYVGFAWMFGGGPGGSPRETAGFVASVIFLVPGFPLVTGSLDVVRLDLEAGISRLTYAALVMLTMGVGVWSVASMAGISQNAVPALELPLAGLWAVRASASFMAVLGWAMMFNAPLRVALASGAIAVAGNALRLGLADLGLAVHVAVFFGALLIGLACHLVGWVWKLPVLIMTVPTLLVMFPGASGVRSLMYFNSGDLMSALAAGIVVVLQVIAMVAGLAAAMMLTDPEWAFTRSDPPTLRRVARGLSGGRPPAGRLSAGPLSAGRPPAGRPPAGRLSAGRPAWRVDAADHDQSVLGDVEGASEG